jgi:hypothetical protein
MVICATLYEESPWILFIALVFPLLGVRASLLGGARGRVAPGTKLVELW